MVLYRFNSRKQSHGNPLNKNVGIIESFSLISMNSSSQFKYNSQHFNILSKLSSIPINRDFSISPPTSLLKLFFTCTIPFFSFCQNVHFPYPTMIAGNIFHPNHPQKYTYISPSNPPNSLIYWSFLVSSATVSTCPVPGNISTPTTFTTSYPLSCSTSKSRTRLVGLQEI